MRRGALPPVRLVVSMLVLVWMTGHVMARERPDAARKKNEATKETSGHQEASLSIRRPPVPKSSKPPTSGSKMNYPQPDPKTLGLGCSSGEE